MGATDRRQGLGADVETPESGKAEDMGRIIPARPSQQRVHPVSPGLLGLIERLVGPADQIGRVRLGLGHGGPHAHCHGAVQPLQGLNRLADALSHGPGIGHLGVGQDDGELLPTVARHMVVGPGLRFDGSGHRLQRLVSGQVAILVVIGLEVVHIHHQQGQR